MTHTKFAMCALGVGVKPLLEPGLNNESAGMDAVQPTCCVISPLPTVRMSVVLRKSGTREV